MCRVPALFIKCTFPPTAVGLKDGDGSEWLHSSKVLYEHVSGAVNLPAAAWFCLPVPTSGASFPRLCSVTEASPALRSCRIH